MGKWQRALYTPVLPLGPDHSLITGSASQIRLSRTAASEGMVLLKNEHQVLPLKTGEKVALFGKATIDYVKGGGGSGDVTVAYIRNLYEGMKIKEKEGKVSLYHDLCAFYEKEVAEQYKNGAVPGMTREPELQDRLLDGAADFADTAIISICRFSGEGWDRKNAKVKLTYKLWPDEEKKVKLSESIFEDGDFYLTHAEKHLVAQVTEKFKKVVLVMNVGGMVDSTWFKKNDRISSVLMAWQGGMEGGLAAADILCGDVTPSGKLTDTFAASMDDYPSSENFNESPEYVEYTDDIYVGYRYFETIPGAKDKVNYPFGFGLSYTTFALEVTDAGKEADTIRVTAKVSNTGTCAGKEVVEVYVKAPAGKLGKPERVLTAYQKTKLLAPGESQVLQLVFPIAAFASYDDLGKVQKSAYLLESGTYSFYVGTDVRNAVRINYELVLDDTIIVEQLSEKASPKKLTKRLLSDGSYEKLPVSGYAPDEEGLPRQDPSTLEGLKPAVRGYEACVRTALENNGKPKLLSVAEGQMSLDEFVAALPVEELVHLIGGQPNTGVANTYGIGNLPEYGIPNVMTADGPAGLRIRSECGVTTTAWPCATQLASTWNPELIEQVGAQAAEEVKENNICVWLTPAMNIHRSPMCGRNFEYYSEDPLVAGISGAAMVRGIQSRHIGASVKHFCCNNKESNRKGSDSRVSERALREIYLKGFEIVVKQADPYTIMSSYNLINGCHASEHKDILTGILRGEWNYQGMVTTDWWTQGEHYREAKAGNDLKMGNGYPERVLEAYDQGYISRRELETNVKRILGMILKLD